MGRSAPALVATALLGCSAPSDAPKPPDEEASFAFLASARPPPRSSAAYDPSSQPARAPSSAAPLGPCTEKGGSSLASRLESMKRAGDASPLPVTASFATQKEGDEVPGLAFVSPTTGTGRLTPAQIEKLCDNPDLLSIDLAPGSFLGR